MMNSKLLLSKKDVASALSISVRTLENLIANKALAARKIGRRTLIPLTALEVFARRDHRTQEIAQPGAGM